MIATCGHEVEDGGISFARKGRTRAHKECMDYVTYCSSCTLESYNDGTMVDIELLKLIKESQISIRKVLQKVIDISDGISETETKKD